jgi:class 3 adenylate cyclase
VSSRTASRLAWGIGALCLAGAVAGLVLAGLSGALGRQWVVYAGVGGALVAYPIVGALVAARQPRNLVGWQLLAVGGFLTLAISGDAYAGYALAAAPGSLPGGLLVAWLQGMSFAPLIWVLLILLPLYFPTGRLLSPRWRLVAWTGAASIVLVIISTGLLPNTIEVSGIGVVHNPFAVPAAAPVLNLLNTLAGIFLLLGIGGAVAAVVVRFRRARGVERAQLKWFTYAVALTPLPFIAYVAIPGLANLLGIVIWPLVPLAVGIAILRYRLYDIDLLITRTLVYGLLTALVTTVYLAVVVGIGTLIGSRGKPNLFLSIVATALIAVAFQPARERSRRLANRLVYGKRATPYEILSEVSRGMAGASTDDSLLRMARLVVEATGAVGATVWLRLGEVLQPQVCWPQSAPLPQPIALEGRGVQEALAVSQAKSRAFPVGHQDELLGALTVTVSPAEPLTLGGEKLIGDLAAQTGLGIRFERMKERALFARALASFLPPEVAELVEASPAALSLREELEATIVFSDIRGFSSLAERLPPREVAEVVGRHLTAMVEVVTSQGGVLDKFAGDAVMAVFGAPRPTAEHARRALGCAVAMQHRQAALNDQAVGAGLPTFQIGIGINTGTVIAGTLGGPGRLDYTVLGDAVNVAQRLQSEAVGGEILASAVTVRQAGTDRAEPVGLKHLKGRQELVEVYRIHWADTPTAQQPLLKGSGPAEA